MSGDYGSRSIGSEAPLTLEDFERESLIGRYALLLETTRSAEMRAIYWSRMKALIARRSPEQVAAMERARFGKSPPSAKRVQG